VGILPFSGVFGEQVADSIGRSMEECGVEVMPRRRLVRQDAMPSDPAEVGVDPDRLAGWAEQFDVPLFLAGDIVMEGERQDKYTRLMLDVRLIDGRTSKVQWSRRTAFWSSASSNRSGDLNRAAMQMGNMLCKEWTLP
jgi:hypothetical protein